ncbi:hypothetical protein ERO13_D11G085001v2 [Gossypium hirsutum]|nr:hypothetical protein ERO13_D11G085001v2 [Gossypium hirsutum]
MKPVVIKRPWIWFTSVRVLHFWRRAKVGSVEFQGWFRFAQILSSFNGFQRPKFMHYPATRWSGLSTKRRRLFLSKEK